MAAEMRSELKKVVWPTRQQVINNTGVALLVMAVSAVVIWGFDQIAQNLVQALITVVKG
jgi:preprotein translocase subunit SecE